MKTDGAIEELANFALLILGIVMNTAGNERQFSKVKICKDRLRNQLQLEKLKQSIKVSFSVKILHVSDRMFRLLKTCKSIIIAMVSRMSDRHAKITRMNV